MTRAAMAIRGILVLQLIMAGTLFVSDLLDSLPNFGSGSGSPTLDSPISPGDQTRRFDPSRRYTEPGGTPIPGTAELPDRLRFTGREVLTLTGAIEVGDAKRFADHIERLGKAPGVIILNSPGGAVSDALQIGRMVREQGMKTELGSGDICLSACPYILFAGVERRVDDMGWVGVHQHYFMQNSVLPAFLVVEEIQTAQGEVMIYIEEMGVDPVLMKYALLTPPEDIYIFVREELERYRIVTNDG